MLKIPTGGALAVVLAACAPADEPETLVKPPRPAVEAAAPPPAPAARGGLAWTGCGVSQKAYIAIAAQEYRLLTGVDIMVTGGGATRGIRATAGGLSDLGGTCRHTLADDYPEERGALLTHVAWDALVFFTHRDNPVDGVSQDQARKILKGEIRSWAALGGPDERIVPVFRQQTASGKLSGVGYMTRLLLFGDPEVEYTADAIFLVSSGPVEEYVEQTPFTFAVTGVSSANKRDVKILRLDGIAATKDNIARGIYPLFRPLFLVTRGEPEGEAKGFVDWLLGEQGQAIISRAGTVNLEEGRGLVARYRHWPDRSVVRNL